MTHYELGAVVQDTLGHFYRIIEGGPFQYRVQAPTLVGLEYQPIGKPIHMGLSEIRATS